MPGDWARRLDDDTDRAVLLHALTPSAGSMARLLAELEDAQAMLDHDRSLQDGAPRGALLDAKEAVSLAQEAFMQAVRCAVGPRSVDALLATALESALAAHGIAARRVRRVLEKMS